MSETSDRRNFLRNALAKGIDSATEVTRGWNEVKRRTVGAVIGDEIGKLAKVPGDTPPGTATAPPVDPEPSRRLARPAELKRLAADLELGDHADAIAAQARVSIRMIPSTDVGLYKPGATRLGGFPDMPAGVEWPRRDDRPMTFLAQVNLGDVRRIGLADGLPANGLLLLFRDFDTASDGTMAADAGAVRVMHLHGQPSGFTARGPDGEPAERGGMPVDITAELVLPDGVTASLPGIDFGPDERVVWDNLRDRLADLQGTSVEDESGPFRSVHRFAGHPDQRRGGMQLTAAICAAGHDVGHQSVLRHPEAQNLSADAKRWRLLFQLSVDSRFGWSWSPGTGRLYVWIREDDLQAGNFDRVWAITQ